MPTSRMEILRSIRVVDIPKPQLPDLRGFGVQYPDAKAEFVARITEVGGRCVFVAGEDKINEDLERLPEYRGAHRVASLVDGVRRANVDLTGEIDPVLLHDVDFCVLRGELGVAESGAVWVSEHNSRYRAMWFLAQHVALVLPAEAIVHNLHQAYERITLGKKDFGIFISGPSKTADIEQALVVGAQGPRSCTVLVVDKPVGKYP